MNVGSVTYDDPNKMGKHAKRRANKKAKQAEQNQQDVNQTGDADYAG